MQANITTLANGLRIATSNRSGTQTVSLGIWVKTGAAYEKLEENGISHFLEHMVFKGTPTRTSFQIDAEIEDVGGQTNAYTSREFTAFYAKMLKEDAELALDVLSDIVLNANFPETELSKERDVVVQEIKQTTDTPDDIIFDYFQDKAFENQALGRTILGPAEKVLSYTGEDLNRYRNLHYAAENMVICAVGNINHQKFVDMVKARFENFRSKTNFKIEEQKYTGGYFAEKRDIEQAHVLLGFKGFNYDSKNYYPATIFSTIFGGGSTSRLFQEIREKRGLVYTTYSFSNAHTGAGVFGIYAGTGREELKQLLPVVTDEIKKITNEKVSEKELQRAKVQLKASMLMGLESSSSSAEIIARQLLIFNRVIPVKEMVSRIENVTLDDVQNIAQTIFSSTPTYTLVGDIDGHPSYDNIQNMLKG